MVNTLKEELYDAKNQIVKKERELKISIKKTIIQHHYIIKVLIR